MNRVARHIEPSALIAAGLSPDAARALAIEIDKRCAGLSTSDAWRSVSQSVLVPDHPFAVHRTVFDFVYRDWDHSCGPPPAWMPTEESAQSTNLARLMNARGLASYADFHAWSTSRRAEFWNAMLDRLGIRFVERPWDILDSGGGPRHPRWLVGAKLNIAASCFCAPPDQVAIIHQREGGPIETLTYAELRAEANRVSNGLIRAGLKPRDAVAIALPMNAHAVAAYLGLVQAGLVVVSLADSLAAEEMAVRLRIAGAKGIFTQDVVRRGGKDLPLYERVVAAGGPRAIVIPSAEGPAATRRPGDELWNDFLSPIDTFAPLACEPDELTNILFSSGTTGEPKAIPWDHVSPLKAATDGCLHQDIQPHDRIAWPTNIGWVMGPWLIYASLINRATMALFDGAPTGRGFGRFLVEAGVSVAGVIPSLVKTWRTTGCMEGLDWSRVRLFSSTGECSNPDDMLWLMARAGYKPVIEYCGGTELSGGYIGSTLLEPNVPSAFTTPSPGIDLVILDDKGRPADLGEVFLVPPSIGMSTRLLNRDHDEVYFDGMPRSADGTPLRRHGDAIERLPNGYFRAHGRVDDTMNLGGIKVSSVEIERVLNSLPGLVETAAVAVSPPGGGPSLLWIFAVPQDDAGNETLLSSMRRALRERLNPLFKIERLVLVQSLPRTPSNKIMRRLLRDRAINQE